jgi:hypothetical protein
MCLVQLCSWMSLVSQCSGVYVLGLAVQLDVPDLAVYSWL